MSPAAKKKHIPHFFFVLLAQVIVKKKIIIVRVVPSWSSRSLEAPSSVSGRGCGVLLRAKLMTNNPSEHKSLLDSPPAQSRAILQPIKEIFFFTMRKHEWISRILNHCVDTRKWWPRLQIRSETQFLVLSLIVAYLDWPSYFIIY